VAITTIDVSGI